MTTEIPTYLGCIIICAGKHYYLGPGFRVLLLAPAAFLEMDVPVLRIGDEGAPQTDVALYDIPSLEEMIGKYSKTGGVAVGFSDADLLLIAVTTANEMARRMKG